jgi:hypothetical protein
MAEFLGLFGVFMKADLSTGEQFSRAQMPGVERVSSRPTDVDLSGSDEASCSGADPATCGAAHRAGAGSAPARYRDRQRRRR